MIAIPKTMDNDVHGTDYCIGFSTAVTRGVEFIPALRTSTGSHERIAVIELFGRYRGETSLVTAYLSGADRAVISEVPFDVERLARLLAGRHTPSVQLCVVTISEGATIAGGDMVLSGTEDAFGHRKLGGIGDVIGDLIGRDHGRGDRAPERRLPDAFGQPGLARPDGGNQLRRDGGRPDPGRSLRPNGGAAQRHVHERADQRRPAKA